MTNFSIIIPHKNTPDLLRECLDSIPKRDDIQVIVVDENSDADKGDFAHFPGIGEPHTEVYLTIQISHLVQSRLLAEENLKHKTMYSCQTRYFQ